MSATLPIGPFDPTPRAVLAFECGLEGPRVSHCRALSYSGAAPVFDDRPLDLALRLASRICARASIAHATAFCLAVEEASRAEVEQGQSALRVALAEHERIASHLVTISDIGFALEDEMLHAGPLRYLGRVRGALKAATGNPFGFDSVVPGGVRLSGDPEYLAGEDMMSGLERATARWERRLRFSSSRLKSAVVPSGLSESMPPSAVFRASGAHRDLRYGEDACGPYADMGYRLVHRDGGTSLDRALLLAAEVRSSASLLRKVARDFPGEREEVETAVITGGSGSGACESPGGAVEHRVILGTGGKVLRNRVGSAAGEVLNAAAGALPGTPWEDAPAALASFGLCSACAVLSGRAGN